MCARMNAVVVLASAASYEFGDGPEEGNDELHVLVKVQIPMMDDTYHRTSVESDISSGVVADEREGNTQSHNTEDDTSNVQSKLDFLPSWIPGDLGFLRRNLLQRRLIRDEGLAV